MPWPTSSAPNVTHVVTCKQLCKAPHDSHHALLFCTHRPSLTRISLVHQKVQMYALSPGMWGRLHQKHMLGVTREMGASRADQRRAVPLLSYWSLCERHPCCVNRQLSWTEGRWSGSYRTCAFPNSSFITLCMTVSFSGLFP